MISTNTHFEKEVYLIIVDDDHEDCTLIQDCFTHLNWHHHVKTLADADTLFDILDATPSSDLLPSLIVLDYHLPQLGGETALMLLKKDERFKRIPVAIYSNTMTERKERKLLALGANFCRKKPTSIDGMHWLMVELMEFAKSRELVSKTNEQIERA